MAKDERDDDAAEARAPMGGLVRTRSGKLVPADQLGQGKRPVPKKDASHTQIAVVAILAIVVLGGIVAALMSGDGSETTGSLDSILRDVGYVIRERKGIGIQR